MTSTITRRAVAALLAFLALLTWSQVAQRDVPAGPLQITPAAAPVAPAAAGGSWASWPPAEVTVISHRCKGNGYVEETLEACLAVANTGGRVLDVDVRWTSDNVPVALHDATLRVFGHPTVAIADLTWAQARTYVAPDGTNLQRLSQVAALARLSGRYLSVEPKVDPTPEQWASLNSYITPTMMARTMLNSFSASVLQEALAQGYDRLALNVKGQPTTPAPSSVPVVIISERVATADTIAQVFQGGADKVWVYGTPSPDRIRQLLELGVTGFATDDHDTAETVLTDLGVY